MTSILFKDKVSPETLSWWLTSGVHMASLMDDYDEADSVRRIISELAGRFAELMGSQINDAVHKALDDSFKAIRKSNNLSEDSILEAEIVYYEH